MAEQVDAAGPVRSRRSLVVGRERERALLRAQLDAAFGGQGSLALIGGEAGIGKTTLVEDLATQAEAAGALVLWGHAYDLTVTPPHGPWVELARSYAPTDDLPPFPAFLHGGEALAAVGSQEALFAQTWAFFAAVAAKVPVMLTLEDLHWADQESLSLLRFVARQLGRHRVLVLATYRSDELTRRHPLYQQIPLLVRETGAERLDVRSLDAAAMRGLIAGRYRLAEPDAEQLVDYLGARAEGNPLYAGELLRVFEDDGVLVARDDGWHLGNLSRLRLPPLLLQMIEGRLARLGDETRRLLQVAAVIGQEVPVDLWQGVSAADDEALSAAIEQGVEAHLLLEAPSGSVRFSHALVREALYQGIVLVRRRVWHRTAGEALAATRAPDPDAVAHHFAQAGDPRAAAWLLQAGERAQLAYAWATAVMRYEAALATLAEQGAPAAERALLLDRIGFLSRFLDPHLALATLTEAHRLAVEAGNPALAAAVLSQSGLLRCFTGDIREGVTQMERAADTLVTLATADQAHLRAIMAFDPIPFDGTLVLWLAMVGRLEEAIARGELAVRDTPRPLLQAGQVDSKYGDCYFGLAAAYALRAGSPARATPSTRLKRCSA